MKNPIETYAGSKYFRLERVAPGVFAAISTPGSGSVANATIVDLGESTLVVDTFQSARAAGDLKAAAAYLTGNPVSLVLNTHWHSDHTSGNQAFAPGAQILSASATYEIMSTFGRNRLAQHLADLEATLRSFADTEDNIRQETDEKLRQEMQWDLADDRAYFNALPELVYTLPTVTFDGQLSLHGRERSVQLLTYGGGHTQSDVFVYLPEERLAIMGDLVVSKHHPVLLSGNPWEWLRILERVELLDIETIVPGHGEVCSKQELREVKTYLADIAALAEEAVRSGKSLDQIQVPEAYRSWYFTAYFKPNLKRVYDLLTSSSPSL